MQWCSPRDKVLVLTYLRQKITVPLLVIVKYFGRIFRVDSYVIMVTSISIQYIICHVLLCII